MNQQKGFTVIPFVLMLVYFLVGIAAVIGWVLNIIDIANADFSHVTGMLIIRIIGIFVAPIGAVLGYF